MSHDERDRLRRIYENKMNGNPIINARIQKMTERKAELLTMKKSERRGELHSVEDIIARLKRWNRELEEQEISDFVEKLIPIDQLEGL